MTKFIKLLPTYKVYFERILATKPATYCNYDATDVKTRQLIKDLRLYSVVNFFGGERISNWVLFAPVNHIAYLRSYAKNPFNFDSFGSEEISLFIENQLHTYKIDQGNKNYILLHHAFLTAVGDKNCGVNPCIKYEDVLGGTALFSFNLSPNRDTSNIQVSRNKT